MLSHSDEDRINRILARDDWLPRVEIVLWIIAALAVAVTVWFGRG